MAKKLVKYWVVDAFTESAFKGNPAAVCLLEEEREEQWLQAIAAEFNISETSYLTRIAQPTNGNTNPRFRLRWFTPVTEVKLCGHATLAAAHSLFSSNLVDSSIIEFETLSGILTVKKIPEKNITSASEFKNGESQDGFFLEMDFPADPVTEFNSAETPEIYGALEGASIIDLQRSTIGDDIIAVLPSAKSVTELEPQFHAIGKCPGKGIIVTGEAPSESGFDFHSRFFCPKFGINERQCLSKDHKVQFRRFFDGFGPQQLMRFFDCIILDQDPVTGSAHCALAPYWSKKLGKCDFNAYQASPRGGIINIHVDEKNQRVMLCGKAVTVMEGCILV